MVSPPKNLIDRCVADLHRRSEGRGRPFLVAVDGRSGVGKSTMAEILADRLDALVVPGDDFYAGGVTVRSDPPAVLAEDCIDWRSLRAVLLALLSSGEARYHPFDWDRFDGSLQHEVTVLKARPIVIVEGVYSGRPELRDIMDFKILMELDPEERMRRLLVREGEISPWETQWHRAEDWYFATKATRERFDAVIDAAFLLAP